jgi:hypothetical protein
MLVQVFGSFWFSKYSKTANINSFSTVFNGFAENRNRQGVLGKVALVFFLHGRSTCVEAPWASLATSCASPW